MRAATACCCCCRSERIELRWLSLSVPPALIAFASRCATDAPSSATSTRTGPFAAAEAGRKSALFDAPSNRANRFPVESAFALMPLALPGGCAVAPATRTVASAPASKSMTPEARFIAPSSHVAPSRRVGTARRRGVYEMFAGARGAQESTDFSRAAWPSCGSRAPRRGSRRRRPPRGRPRAANGPTPRPSSRSPTPCRSRCTG